MPTGWPSTPDDRLGADRRHCLRDAARRCNSEAGEREHGVPAVRRPRFGARAARRSAGSHPHDLRPVGARSHRRRRGRSVRHQPRDRDHDRHSLRRRAQALPCRGERRCVSRPSGPGSRRGAQNGRRQGCERRRRDEAVGCSRHAGPAAHRQPADRPALRCDRLHRQAPGHLDGHRGRRCDIADGDREPSRSCSRRWPTSSRASAGSRSTKSARTCARPCRERASRSAA